VDYVWGVWSPDRSQIAWAHRHRSFYQGVVGLVDQSEVGLIRADGSERSVIASPGSADIGIVQWSPDGRSIVFSTHAGVFVVSRDAHDLRLLQPGAATPQWSPSGRYLAYTAGGGARHLPSWLIIRDMRTNRAKRYPLSPSRLAWGYNWAPRNDRIAVGQRNGLVLITPGGRFIRRLAGRGAMPEPFSAL